MSEPTPLSAEELASVKPIPGDEQWCYYCGFSWPGCFCARAKVTIDAQATEIAALRAVSSQQQQRAQLAEERVAALKGALEEDLCPWHRGGEGMRPYSWDEPCGTKAFLIVKPCERARRVLAGKEVGDEPKP